MHSNRWNFVLIVLRVLLGGVFLYAGTVKIPAPEPFADSIASFQLLPAGLINSMALGLPVFEILLGIWLLSGLQIRSAAFCSLTLAGIFLVALVSAWIRGIPVNCGCFGSGHDPLLGNGHVVMAIVRDLVLLAAAGFLYVTAVDRGSAAKTATTN